MTLVRARRRQLWGGLSVALIGPGALLTSFALLALAGGFGGLGALGQALSGPPIPAAVQTGAGSARVSRPLSNRLLAALPATVRGSRGLVHGPSPTHGTARPVSGQRSPAGPGAPGQRGAAGLTPTRSAQPTSTAPPAPAPRPTATNASAPVGTLPQIP